MQTHEPETTGVEAAAERLMTARRIRANSRQQQRAYLDAMEDEAKRRLATIFTGDDPITGRPVCLFIKSSDRLDDAYEQQTPRAVPDSTSRLAVEILGRSLVVEIDDFGRANVHGVAGAAGLHRVAYGENSVVFLGDGDDANHSHVTFSTLLARLIDDVADQERSAAQPA